MRNIQPFQSEDSQRVAFSDEIINTFHTIRPRRILKWMVLRREKKSTESRVDNQFDVISCRVIGDSTDKGSSRISGQLIT